MEYSPGRPRQAERSAEGVILSADENTSALALRSLLNSNNIRSRRAVLNIPRHSAILKFIPLPSQDPVDIAQMAAMEVLRQIPYGEDEIISAHKLIRRESEGYSLVLLAAVLKEIVDRPVKILRACGLTVERITLGAESLQALFLESHPEWKTRNVLLVNSGADALDVQVLEAGAWVFSRGVSVASFKDRADWLGEVAASVHSHQKVSPAGLEAICFSGPAAEAAALKPLAEELQLKLHVLEPEKNLGFCQNPASIELNLMPPSLLGEIHHEGLKKSLGAALVWGAVFLALFFAAVLKRNLNEERLVGLMDTEIKKNKSRTEEAAKMKQLLAAVRDHAGVKPLAADIFVSIYEAMPEGVMLEMMDYEDRDTLTLRGSAGKIDAVFECAKALEKSSWFSTVRVRYVSKRMVNGQETADFEIQTRLNSEENGENS